jgi:hypothetical protein
LLLVGCCAQGAESYPASQLIFAQDLDDLRRPDHAVAAAACAGITAIVAAWDAGLSQRLRCFLRRLRETKPATLELMDSVAADDGIMAGITRPSISQRGAPRSPTSRYRATVPMLPHALTVMGGWGFDYRRHFAWVKNRIGTGFWNRNKHELLLVGVRSHIQRLVHRQYGGGELDSGATVFAKASTIYYDWDSAVNEETN